MCCSSPVPSIDIPTLANCVHPPCETWRASTKTTLFPHESETFPLQQAHLSQGNTSNITHLRMCYSPPKKRGVFRQHVPTEQITSAHASIPPPPILTAYLSYIGHFVLRTTHFRPRKSRRFPPRKCKFPHRNIVFQPPFYRARWFWAQDRARVTPNLRPQNPQIPGRP